MAKPSTDFDVAEAIFLSEVLDGNEGVDLDAKFAELFQFQEALFLSAKEMSSSTPRPTSSSAAKAAGESSQSFCNICFDGKERNQMFKISAGCSHSYCSDCITTCLKTRLEQNITIIMCPGENCGLTLELEACRDLLPKELISLWEDLLCQELICATAGRLYCPYNDCSEPLLNDNQREVITETECPFCHRLFCAQCNVSWHPGFSCEEYQKLNEDDRGREDLMMMNLAIKNKWPRCPSCHMIVERTEGCLHMTCRCKFEFCYKCGSEWTQDHGGCQGN